MNGHGDQEGIQLLSSYLQEQQKEGILASLAADFWDFREQSCGFQVLKERCPALAELQRFRQCPCRGQLRGGHGFETDFTGCLGMKEFTETRSLLQFRPQSLGVSPVPIVSCAFVLK